MCFFLNKNKANNNLLGKNTGTNLYLCAQIIYVLFISIGKNILVKKLLFIWLLKSHMTKPLLGFSNPFYFPMEFSTPSASKK